MRVLQINIVCGKYSTGIIATSIAETLQNNGEECYIAYEGTEETWFEKTYKIGNVWTQRIHSYLFSKMFDAQGFGSIWDTKRFLKWIDSIQPDIIHLHNIHGSYLNYPMLFNYIYKKNIPVVWTIHDCWPTTGHCAHFFPVNCNKWRVECFNCPLTKSNRVCLIDRSRANYKAKKKYFNLPQQMILVPVSKWMASIMKDGLLSKYPTEVIYNGIDLSIFKPTDSTLRHKLRLEGKFIILGVASSWYKEKGIEDYFKLAKELGFSYQIVLLGMSEEQISMLPNEIIGLPKVSSTTELAQYYTMADVVTSLSYGESMGLTPIEGMACGTPAIVYDNTAQPELVNENTGFVVPTGNIPVLVEKIKTIEVLQRKDNRFTNNCITWVTENFNREEQYKKYLNVYRKLLRNKYE